MSEMRKSSQICLCVINVRLKLKSRFSDAHRCFRRGFSELGIDDHDREQGRFDLQLALSSMHKSPEPGVHSRVACLWLV